MKKRFSEEQIAFALRQHENGTTVAEIVRKMGITEQTFCYYLDKGQVVPVAIQNRMSEEVLEAFTRQYITGQDAETVTFNWHGGEPALLGLDFYRKAVELQKKYANGKPEVSPGQARQFLAPQAS